MSSNSTRPIQNLLLHDSTETIPDSYYDNVLSNSTHPSSSPPSGLQAHKQRFWDKASVESSYSELLASQPDDYHRARLIAAAAAHSGDWLHALPIAACGLRLEDEAIRVAVGLRLGANICEAHNCPVAWLLTVGVLIVSHARNPLDVRSGTTI